MCIRGFKISFFIPFICSFAITEDLVEIREGSFWMGQEGIQDDEEPIHQVLLDAFEIDRFETSIGDWKEVQDWALDNGYDFSESSFSPWGKPYWYFESQNDDFPVNRINWYDAVKWCNAKSEYLGRSVVYYTNSAKTNVYRTGEIDLSNSMVDWQGVGYRLPTEEEWEKAARGGIYNQNYPWGNFIDGSFSNYKLSGDPLDDGTTPRGYFNGGQKIYEAELSLDGESNLPVDRSNNFGLYDLIGNVSEWCWDWYDPQWYSRKNKSQSSYGPSYHHDNASGQSRLHRGGGYKDGPGMDEGKPLRTAFRGIEFPGVSRRSIGFRCVRSMSKEELWVSKQDLSPVAKNWFFMPWFGYFYQSSVEWVFHPDLGWVFPSGSGSYDNWLFFPKCGWMWTSRLAYPHFYNVEKETWYMLDKSLIEKGWFKSVDDDQYIRWGRDFPQ